MYKFTQDEVNNIIDSFKNKISIKTISKIFNCDRRVIKNCLASHGVRTDQKILFSENQINEIIDKHTNERLSPGKIAVFYNVTSPTISKILKEKGVFIKNITPFRIALNERRNIFSNENCKYILNSFLDKTKTIKQLSLEFKCSTWMIRNFLKRSKIIFRKHTHNKNYFENIDTPNKAYFLGLFYADLTVRKYSFRMKHAAKDLYIIESFKRDINSTHPIILDIHEKETQQNQYEMRICCKKTVNDLIKLGCYPNKSLTLKFPTNEQVPIPLIPHFIRGFFDGDGGVSFGLNKNAPRIKITSTLEMLTGIKTFLNNFLNAAQIQIRKDKNIYRLEFAANEIVRKFYNLIYKDAELFFPRKKDLMKRVFDYKTARSSFLEEIII